MKKSQSDILKSAQVENIELTILMPCLNEAETIEKCITKAMDFLDRSGIDGEILISDNGSNDGSDRMARALGARVVYASERGYGAALITGIAEARGGFIIMGDSDDSYDFSDLDLFVAKLRGGADLVMGNRFSGGIARHAMPPLHRYFGNPVLSFLGRLFYRSSIGDFHCGLRGFNAATMRSLKLSSPGMEFASEMIIKSTVAGCRIEEVPTKLHTDGRSRPPHLRSWSDGWRHLQLLASFAPHWLFYYPGVSVFGVGLFLFSILLFGPVTVGGLTFDVATLILASAAIITGAQMLFFYGLARLFTSRFGLLPKSDRFVQISPWIGVNNACAAGGGLLTVAVGATIWALVFWAGAGFGDLIPGQIVRPAALAVVTAALGVQVITFGFLWDIINQSIPAFNLARSEGTSIPGNVL